MATGDGVLLALVLSSPLMAMGVLWAMQCFESWMLGPDRDQDARHPVAHVVPREHVVDKPG